MSVIYYSERSAEPVMKISEGTDNEGFDTVIIVSVKVGRLDCFVERSEVLSSMKKKDAEEFVANYKKICEEDGFILNCTVDLESIYREL